MALVLGCVAAVAPAAARADPITTGVNSTSAMDADALASDSLTLDWGTIRLRPGSSQTIAVDGLQANENYVVNFAVTGNPSRNPWDTLTVEILDPLSDGFDGADPSPQPGYVPAGFSTSNNSDGLSFAWNSGLERSATFASGGSATLFVDEDTDARDLLRFSGFSGGDTSRVTFGLRDRMGGHSFVVRLSVNGRPITGLGTPEPASLLLLGTGLAGLVRARKRRQIAA